MKIFIATVLIGALALSGLPVKAETVQRPKANVRVNTEHHKVIDFDGDLVEGVNKRPWDSLSQISDQNARRRNHLYRKRTGFSTENKETLMELRYVR